jgi:hypothetical protein
MLLYRCAAKPVKPERSAQAAADLPAVLSISSLPVCLIAVYGFLEGRLAELGTPPYAPDP